MKSPTLLRPLLSFLILWTLFPVIGLAAPARTAEWIRVLHSPDASIEDKAKACRQIGEFGTPDAVPALASLLGHDVLNPYARTGLERLGDPSATAALRSALGTLTGNNLAGVVDSLGALRDAGAVEALQALIAKGDRTVAQSALRALGNIATERATKIVLQYLDSRTSELRQEAATACMLSAERLMSAGSNRAAQTIYDRVRALDLPIAWRIGATRGAILARQQDQIPFLMEQLRSEDARIRNVALLTVRDIPSEALASSLNAEAKRAEGDFQIQLIAAIRDCPNNESHSLLNGLMDSADPAVRLAAADSFSRICTPAESPGLVRVLAAHPGSPEAELAWDRLARKNDPGIDSALLKALSGGGDRDARISMIRLLGERKTRAAADLLIKEAGGGDAEISLAAYQSLRPIAGSAELGELISQTRHRQNERVREAGEMAIFNACRNSDDEAAAAAMVLGALKSASTVADLVSWSRVLSLLGYEPALDSVAAGLHHSNPEVVSATIRQLGQWPGPGPIPKLFSVVESNADSDVKKRALLGVIQLATAAADRKEASPEAIAAWFERAGKSASSPQERRRIIAGLGRLHHADAIRLLMNYADDAELKTEAAFALVAACGPMTKGSEAAIIRAALEKVSGVGDENLRRQVNRLKRETIRDKGSTR